MTKFMRIPCQFQNHGGMNYEYVCLNINCQRTNSWLCCLNCCQEFHQAHKDSIITIKQIMQELQSQKYKKTEYNLLEMLTEGMETCRTAEELKINTAELLAYRNNPNRFEKILDEDMQTLRNNTQRNYQRAHELHTARSVSQKSSIMVKPLVNPILTFKESPQYTLNSPFCITSRENQLITAFALPCLSKIHDSIDVKIKIDRLTPSWIGLGLSIGQSKYEEKSSKHLLAISNGWTSNRGVLEPSKVSFRCGDEVRLKWDKNMEIVEISSQKNKETIRFASKWNEEIYLCICLFYKGDTVSLLA